MVGVAGRSKGCQKCRDRRVKCDETRPQCIRCTRVGYTCPGYVRTLTFVHTNSSANDVSKALTSKALASIGQPLLPSRVDAYVDVFIRDFLNTSTPYQEYASDNLIPYRFGHIIAPYGADTPRGRRCRLALECSATTYVGSQLKSRDIQIDGQNRYIRLLAHVRQCVDKGFAAVASVEFLYSCMMAANYEFISNQNSLAWIAHVSGLAQIVQSQGPYAFQETFPRNLLMSIRGHIWVNCVLTERRCFLSKPDWLYIPWLNAKKGMFDHLLDAALTIPNVMCDAKDLPYGGDYNRLISGVFSTLAALDSWRNAWEFYMSPRHLTVTDSSSLMPRLITRDEFGPLYTTVLFFSNLSIATTYLFYNTWITTLGLLALSLEPWIRHDEWRNLINITFHCTEICRLLDFFSQPEYSKGSTGIFFALKVALDALPPNSREYKLIGRIMQKTIVGERASGANVQNLLTINYGPPPPSLSPSPLPILSHKTTTIDTAPSPAPQTSLLSSHHPSTAPPTESLS